MNQTAIVGVPATLVPMDAIGDLTVQQTPSAEFGVKGGAAINIVMKSGTNKPHGTGTISGHDDTFDSTQLLRYPLGAAARQGGGPDANQEPAVRRDVRRADQEGQGVLLRLLRGAASERHRAADTPVPTDAQVASARARDRRGRPHDEPDRRAVDQVLPDRSAPAISMSTARPSRT